MKKFANRKHREGEEYRVGDLVLLSTKDLKWQMKGRRFHVRWYYSNSSVLVRYILVAAQKDSAIELRNKLDNFKDKFMVELTIDMRVEQGLAFAPDSDCPTCLICGISHHSR